MFGFRKNRKSNVRSTLAAANADAPPASQEQIDRLIQELKEPLKEHEEEKRKSLEINTGFFDKLSALSAGSIAVAASIVLAVVLKSEPRPEWFRTALHEVLTVVGLLWLSLVLAILHNFLATVFVNTEAKLSEAQLVWTMAERVMAIVAETAPAEQSEALRQFKPTFREQFLPRERKLAKRSLALYTIVRVVGYASMLVFVVAFSLVPLYLFRLW